MTTKLLLMLETRGKVTNLRKKTLDFKAVRKELDIEEEGESVQAAEIASSAK